MSKILSIDIGIINLGYVYGITSTSKFEVLECNRVDITLMRHNKVKYCECKLHHDFCIPDYLDHFIQERQDLFDNADVILIERQPIMGIMNVQDLLFVRFRNKVKLISPNSVHKFFKMSSDYDTRKIESVNIAKSYLDVFTSFTLNDRQHDITDALLIILFYLSSIKIKKIIPILSKDKSPFEFFDTFKFT